jgi:hypothetical protein
MKYHHRCRYAAQHLNADEFGPDSDGVSDYFGGGFHQ